MDSLDRQTPLPALTGPDLVAATTLQKSSAWLVSLLLHLGLLLLISLISIHRPSSDRDLIITSIWTDEPPIEELSPREFHFDATPRAQIGGSQLGGPLDDLPGQMQIPESPQIPALDLREQDRGQIEYRELVEAATGLQQDLNHTVRGTAGVGVTHAEGAIDRITHEILLSLEERKTLVVWFFDQSGSLSSQREAIHARFRRVYEELGTIEAAGDPAFASHAAKPLLTSVVAFGEQVHFMIKTPTDDLQQIQDAVAQIEADSSGVEMVFTAVQMATTRFRKYRALDPATADVARNVLFVVFSDEVGDDQEQLDSTVRSCRRLAIPVYVVGVPAPFGRRETLVKWVDPDPRYDQTPQWGAVTQGPESLLPEQVNVHFVGAPETDDPIDSGFGPFALTRLCSETGGIYFTVHPNRNTERSVGRGETAAYAAHLRAFFDPDAMRRYRPDYVSAQEYQRNLRASRARSSLVQAAELPWIAPPADPRLRFVFRDEASFARELTEAQKDAAKLQPDVQQLCELLKQGESDRAQETVPRWQAGYDLAMGRALAIKVRTEGYNGMLAQAKRGMKFHDPQSNTWQLKPTNEIQLGSQLKSQAAQAREYLQRVVQQHPQTPWAWLAQRELSIPLGWEWAETVTPLDPPSTQVAVAINNPNPPAPADDRPRMIPRPPPRRPPPKL